MKVPDIEKDPELEAQERAARNDKIDAIRERVSSKTTQAMRLFGSRWAMSGSKGIPLMAGK